MTVKVAALTGTALAAGIPAVARLRIAVFRHWPYLYDGSMDYETRYLSKFAAAGGAIIVAAYDGDTIVGCATAAPLTEVDAEFSAPLRARGSDVARIFYCGESVLLPAYRGRGLGHAFFDHREAQGRALGTFTHSAFCAVVRPKDHALRPKDYVPLDAFWERRGYAKVEGLVARFTWKDVDQPAETAKPMQFWMKAL
ncbi:MAG: GNAT family N-acetyltransferase [Hyphomonadaceae bacterium]|jgi:GNAT superfamily N-acetyltransferase|nr:GNAT family N-acetyltransferase [Hyphomonadaceae bacterium]